MKNQKKNISHLAQTTIKSEAIKGGARHRAELDHLGSFNYTYPGG